MAVDKRAERIQRLASKEVGLGSLQVTSNISKKFITHTKLDALRMA